MRPHTWASIAAFAAAVAAFAAPPAMRTFDLRCEYRINPLGIDARRPRLSWKLAADPTARGKRQTAYQIQVATDPQALRQGRPDLWDSGKVASSDTVLVPYGGGALASQVRCAWRVRSWDENDRPSAWSRPASWTMGILAKADWHAQWIGSLDESTNSPWFRKSFELATQPASATVTVSSIGYHELYLNGQKVGDGVLEPAVSDLAKRARYVAHDVTKLLRPGWNVLGLWLGVGWSRYKHYHQASGPLGIVQLDIRDADGRLTRIVSDGTWETRPSDTSTMGAWTFWNFHGERIDGARSNPSWWLSESAKWSPVRLCDPEVDLSAQTVEPDRLVKRIRPVKLEEVSPQVYRFDMGRSFTGWTEVKLRGAPGTTVVLNWSERPNEKRTYNQSSEYLLGPADEGVFHHRFNYATGRWITLEGLTSMPKLADVEGWLVHSGYRPTTRFECSNDLLNRIFQTVAWTYECLSLGGYVVDCPHRERLGYGGDAHATTATGLRCFDLGAFATKWAEDWRDVQAPDGNLPFTAPTMDGGGGPAWSGFCVLLPWEVYQAYGDRRILEDSYPTMKRWLAFLDTKCEGPLLKVYQDGPWIPSEWQFLGEWISPGVDQTPNGKTEETLFFNNAYRLYNLRLASRIAAVVGQADDAARFARQAEVVREAVHRRFWRADKGVYVSGGQSYQALALLAEVPPPELRAQVLGAIEKDIRVTRKGHLDTGILGTRFLIQALEGAGRDDLLYEIASKKDFPSWGYMLEKGATTIWEQWDGENSRCHSSFLSIGAWLVEGIGGIRPDPDAPGYRRFIIRPGLLGTLKWAKTSYDSIHGKIECVWRIVDRRLIVEVVVPPNTSARVEMPDGAHEIGSGSYRFESPIAARRPPTNTSQAR